MIISLLIQTGIEKFNHRICRGSLKSLGTDGTLDLLNGHFFLAIYAGGGFFNMKRGVGGDFTHGGQFRRWIYIWWKILGADCKMEEDIGGRFTYGGQFRRGLL
jgi:hypothetical protein